jgi:hypothetical protein
VIRIQEQGKVAVGCTLPDGCCKIDWLDGCARGVSDIRDDNSGTVIYSWVFDLMGMNIGLIFYPWLIPVSDLN